MLLTSVASDYFGLNHTRFIVINFAANKILLPIQYVLADNIAFDETLLTFCFENPFIVFMFR